MIKSIYKLSFLLAIIGFTYSCTGDLNTVPIDPDLNTSEVVYDDPATYKGVLAKLYAGLAVTGQQGPAGQADIGGIDEGFSQYVRALWYHQELPTDEAVIGWNDQTIKNFHGQSWTSSDAFIAAFYSRIFYQITLANEFIRETTDEKLDGRGVSADLKAEINGFRAEARFLRALSYWHALDHFRNVPFVTEDDLVGSFFPEQINANDLFDYIESELLAIENDIAPVRTNEYARADQGAVWALLAKLYLNAEVYINTPKYTQCIEACNKIVNGGYTLDEEYHELFLADNHKSNEIIFPITYDGVHTKTYGGTTFIISAGVGGSMPPSDSGISGGWGGTRTTKQIVEKFGTIGGVIVAAPDSLANLAKIYAPGSYQGNDVLDPNCRITSKAGNKIFEGYKYFPEPNGTIYFQIIASSSAPKLGDNNNDGILETQGAAINVTDAGLHFVQVNLNDNTYKIEPVQWGIVGDGVGSWDNDVVLEWDETKQALRAEVPTSAGEIKFRANGAWDINLGDDNGDGILEYGEANIAVPDGSYEILLYINRPEYYYSITQASFDTRGIFYTKGQNLEINDLSLFTDGYAVQKFKNLTSNGVQGSDNAFPDTDFPVFRLADIHLMAAEAILRSGGNIQDAVNHVNIVRARAFKSNSAGINASQLTLDFLLDERARELYWECHRRTDLIRFGQFTDGTYTWAWKGEVKEGTSVGDYRKLFPLPISDLGANSNLKQNDGY